MGRIFIKSFLILFLIFSLPAFAQDSGDTGKGYSTKTKQEGVYCALTSGMLYFTEADRLTYKDGWVVGLRMGYDFLPYLGLEAQFKYAGINTTRGTTPPFSHHTYQTNLMAKGAYPITRRIRLGLGAGAGIFFSSPNLTSRVVGSSTRFIGFGQFDAEYFTRFKGLSFGLDPSVGGVKDLKSAIVQISGFLRYTF